MTTALEKQIGSTRLKSIDALRGAAAMAVLLFHAINFGNRYGEGSTIPAGPFAFQFLYSILNHGDLGVALFFVISGFCIHLRWARQAVRDPNPRLDMWDFWKRRMYRLYPAYLAMLVISMTLVLVACFSHQAINTLSQYPEPTLKWIGIDFAAHVLMLHGLHPILWKTGGNAVLWTLAIEEYFYLMYLALLSWRQKWGLHGTLVGVFAIGTVTSALSAVLFSNSPILLHFMNSSAPVLWIQWCLGMAAAEAYCGLTRLPAWTSNIRLMPIWAAMAVMCQRWGGPVNNYFGTLAPLLWGLTFFTLMGWCIRREQRGQWACGAVSGPILGRLATVGVFSYSLYLVHLPVRSGIRYLLRDYADSVGPGMYVVIAAGMAAAGYLCGKLFFRIVESRFIGPPSSRPKANHRELPVPEKHAVAVA